FGGLCVSTNGKQGGKSPVVAYHRFLSDRITEGNRSAPLRLDYPRKPVYFADRLPTSP
ncbi:hypothetical protein ACLOJK_001437, partial [Asimina triloba]